MCQQQWRFENSIRVLSEGVAENPLAPGWVTPTLLLRRGNNRTLIVDPAVRVDTHRVRADVRWRDFQQIRGRAVGLDREASTVGGDQMYAALVPANRLVVERRWHEAATAYESVRQQHPSDLQVR